MAHTTRTVHGDSANASVELADRQAVAFCFKFSARSLYNLFIRPLVRCGSKVLAVDAKNKYRSTHIPLFSRGLGSKNPREKRNCQ